MKPNTQKLISLASRLENKLQVYAQTSPPATPVAKPATAPKMNPQDVKFFQQMVTYYVAQPGAMNLKIKNMLDEELAPDWNAGGNEADGLWGPRTSKAFEIVKSQLGATDLNEAAMMLKESGRESAVAQEKTYENRFQNDINVVKNKLAEIHKALSSETNNFTNKLNIGTDELYKKYLPVLNPEYAVLYQANQKKQLAGLEPQFKEIVNSMQQLFRAVMGGTEKI